MEFRSDHHLLDILDMERQEKVCLMPVVLHYRAAVLLCNCLTCLKGGNEISDYFKIDPPPLQEHIQRKTSLTIMPMRTLHIRCFVGRLTRNFLCSFQVFLQLVSSTDAPQTTWQFFFLLFIWCCYGIRQRNSTSLSD